ncbi:MAG: competence/damage-inducible protein A [Tissierellia bacterium]|nr:competence/damage-inducible protein A [Tissierellia bacterium]
MRAEIITVGSEIILGSILNTNAQYLTRRLGEIGIEVLYHTSLKDNKEQLKQVIKTGLKRADLLIFTGGLGPTGDDFTKEVVSETLGLKLYLDKNIKNNIQNYFNKNNKSMTPNNIKQAYIPEGSKSIKNDIGTAPGIFIEWENKILVLLPGPPREMQHMFNKYIIPLIKQDCIMKETTIKTIGIGESHLETILKDIINSGDNPTIATYASEGIVDIKIVAKGNNEDYVNTLLRQTIEKIKDRIAENIYSYNNETIEEVVYKLLKENKLKIAFAESCTGGLITSRFTKIPGVSEVFDRGIVTYSNISKMKELNVKKHTLDKYGAVSKEVALEMAKGLLEKTNVDIALSTTGLAGPTNGDENKPIGLVFIGIATKEELIAKEFRLSGDRTSVQNKASLNAFNELRKILLNM